LILGCLTFLVPVLLAIPAVIFGILALRDVKRGQGRVSGKGMAMAGLITGAVGNISLLPILWLWSEVGEGSARRDSQDNLKQLGLAMHAYHDTFRALPPAAITDKQTGRPLLSWRVAILPYVEEMNLYQQFRLGEAWDGPNNSRLLAQMPKIYAPVRGSTPQPHSTYYQLFTGPNTPFRSPQDRTMLQRFMDGTSNTFLIAEAGEAVPWTKPDDIVVMPNAPLPRLGGMWRNGFNVVMADGSVRWVDTRRVSEPTLRILIDPSDGQIIPPEFHDGFDGR
jgi:prepilin-type processing-associated H-X9-DG protein